MALGFLRQDEPPARRFTPPNLSIVLTVLSYAAFVACELCDQIPSLPWSRLSDEALRVKYSLLWVGVGVAFAAPLVPWYPSWIPPFEGGTSFILLQAHGWTLLGVVLFVSLFTSAEALALRGFVAIGLGGAALFADGTLLVSVLLFEPAAGSHLKSRSDEKRPKVTMGCGGIVGGVLPSAALALGACACFMWCEVHQADQQAPAQLGLACGLMALSALWSHVINVLSVPGYKPLQPFQGGLSFVLLQAEGWMLLAFVLNFGLMALQLPSVSGVFPGAIALCGIAQLIANSLLIGSSFFFSPAASMDEQLSALLAPPLPESSELRRCWQPLGTVEASVVWLLGLLLAVLPALVLYTGQLIQLPMLCDDLRAPLFLMFLSAPVTHMAGLIGHQGSGYALYQPLYGGFRYVTAQSFGWLLYAIAVALTLIGALNGWLCQTDNMLPICFFAQATISSSVLFFEPSGTTPASPPKPSSSTVDLPWRPVVLGLAAVAALHIALLPSESAAPLGWAALATLCVVTLSGIHMVWTHVWLIGSGAVLLTGDPTALAVAACLGANISAVWYIALIWRREMRVPLRAMNGWSRWICGDLIGLREADYKGNVSLGIVHSLPTGFFITDIGVHLVPTLVLLQLAAPHITVVTVVLGYLASRVWSVAITSHHFFVDWEQLRTKGAIRLHKREPQPVTAYVNKGVINDIYAFEPPAPVDFFTFAVVLEATVAASFLTVTLAPISTTTRSYVFSVLGASPLVSVSALTKITTVCVAVGGLTIAVGAVLAYITRPKQAHLQDCSRPVLSPKKNS